MISSPCVKVCVMLPDRDVCTGCYRTLEEIAQWGGMSEPERRRAADHPSVILVSIDTPL